MSKSRTKTTPVPIMLDKEHSLTLDMAAIADIHEHAGVNLLTGDPDLIKKLMEPRALSVTVWALMGGPDSELTVREVQRQLTMERLENITNAVFEVLSQASDEPASESGGGKAKK